MPLRDDLLNPVAGDNPAGADLRYDPLYDKIKEARREDDDAPQGEWQRARKLADWPQVIKLAGDALATKSKDLQLAVWLAEAMLRREGYGAFRATLDVIRGMLDTYWEHLYPEIEDGDLEMRAAPLEWLGSRIDLALRSVPLNRAGHDFLRYKDARSFGYEDEAAADDGKSARRAEAIEEGRPTPEDFDKSLAETPKPFYKQLVTDLEGTLASLQALDELSRDKFGDVAPSYIRLRETVEDVERTARQLLAKKLEQDPDPPEAEPVMAASAGDGVGAAAAGSGAPAPAAGGVLAAEPTDRNDAAQRVIGAARFLRRTEPRNPASYLMLRALRWGELRADGATPDPKLLEAPTTQVRTQLRGLVLDSAWEQLLELAETVMGTPVGRGWLDLQRYALTALQGMGEDYAVVAAAIRAELRALLAAVPALPTMTLMDDMPTANGATLEWLRESGLIGGEAEVEEAAPLPVAAPDGGDRGSRVALDRATAEVRAGRPDKAIELLMRALEREKSRRGRFLRQAQLAQVMVEAGLVAVARPILEELLNDIENHKLEEWEAGALVAQPMALLYKVLDKIEDDSGTKESLYLRICRLDPLQAIGFAQA
ncbi:MAG TPA: type VI secretion system protein TssA [Gemmatimonadaceae bacterium]|nr:type VI secretion system protein TssA [Gemmatimonadaceae bacterium]